MSKKEVKIASSFEKCILFIFGLFLAVAIGWLGYTAINEIAVKEVSAEIRVVHHKQFSPATYTQICQGDPMICTPIFIPETYSLCFEFEPSVVACGEVGLYRYVNSEAGQKFFVSYGHGRIDGRYIVRSIKPLSQ
ncbi:MAG: hypothetical protein WC878_08280 [Candidatus Paceibacterota bacterium]|jgi:hypothetical protein